MSDIQANPIVEELPAFEGPRLKVARAKRHIAELEAILSEYADRAKPVWAWYWEPLYEHMKWWQLTMTEHPPKEIPLIIGDAAHNLRAALDIMLCDIARLRHKSTDGVKFLFAVSEAKWDEALKKHSLKRLGPDVVAAVRALNPFRDHNSGLRALHDLDILDKHELIVLQHVAYKAEPRQPHHPPIQQFCSGDVVFIRDGMERELTPRLLGKPFLIFRGNLPAGSPFAGFPVLETLNDAAQAVEEIVESFALQFGGK